MWFKLDFITCSWNSYYIFILNTLFFCYGSYIFKDCTDAARTCWMGFIAYSGPQCDRKDASQHLWNVNRLWPWRWVHKNCRTQTQNFIWKAKDQSQMCRPQGADWQKQAEICGSLRIWTEISDPGAAVSDACASFMSFSEKKNLGSGKYLLTRKIMSNG